MNHMSIIFTIVCILLIILDFCKRIELTGVWLRLPVLFFIPNYILVFIWMGGLPISFRIWFTVLSVYILMRFHLYPFRYNKSGGHRVRIMYGGRLLLKLSFIGSVMEAVLCLLFFTNRLSFIRLQGHGPLIPSDSYALKWFLINLAVCLILFLGLWIYNGTVRILLTCRRLGIVKRALIFCNMWIPAMNLFLIHYLCRKAEEEYAQECCRFELKSARIGSHICAMRYPLIMVHGIGFRDLKYFNYWGRIPKELSNNGARVYYGHQNAWGTIEDNARALHDKIESVLAATGAEKVNIIAHSKGGLDARYVISGLHMEDKVASLTTVNTPHYGSELIDVLNKLPDGVYRLIASWLDRSFHKLGDREPDCYHSSKQLSPEYCRIFNMNYPDAPGIYYQSYASVMESFLGDSLLSIPYIIMKLATGEKNDGLVTERSAKWGDFRGTFRNEKHGRGISHGDMIDLKREDYRGFDVIEKYNNIVAELKEKGF